jgi:large subunit ribosomal protein L31
MKQGIHPEYVEAHVRCTCGNEFTTRSTKPELHVEICSECHPYYTGRQKLVDTGGRVDRFQRRAAKRHTSAGIRQVEFRELCGSDYLAPPSGQYHGRATREESGRLP